MKVKIGVLAMQGAFVDHEKALQMLDCETMQIRTVEQLNQVQGLIIPGGESTTIGKLMDQFGLIDAIQERSSQGMPIWGTCAGMILLAKEIEASDQLRLGLMDIKVRRNAFGRQVDSFEVPLDMKEIGDEPFPAVFIRAPYISEKNDQVKVLATHEEKTVAVRQGHLLAAAFHPELTDDSRMHQYFLDMVQRSL
ncbi:pyridoxal 5'-phosphate synthase glutaminase subunit PdxT [Heliorestis acidaminivorans]|uniref:Pyridoxal 5'-phosphate synthase subunit PdxT n=1 Tax=Heliorestis acidaminivorans TaxID=553427 RepID=A0A6I0EUA7_9FIRM|nr:pyridoxal 5'-phosphate synthase glutaminase subunit PdxT [Heliorestis acidaminivorans]KAB2952873.1 pyridoxal 5'-phosphate synthase glutaminase subunit PdxT [Heliorestis acidaminivorans]